MNTSGNLTNKLGSIFKSNDSNGMKNYFDAIKNGIAPSVAFKNNLTSCSKEVKKNSIYMAQNRKAIINGTMSYEQATASLKSMSLASKAAAVGMKALSIAGNMLLFMAIAQGIQLAIKGIDNLANAAEHCSERVEELMSSYKTAIDQANSNAKTVEELAGKYKTLSKGVNNLGENVSLTTDEYAEYNKVVDQIADMFPTLITGYTDEGTAILSLKGNVEKLRDAYKEAQQEAYNMLIVSSKASDGNDIIKQYKNLSKSNILYHAPGTEDFEATAKRKVAQLVQNSDGDVDELISDLNRLMKNSSYNSPDIIDFLRNELGLNIGNFTTFSGFSDTFEGKTLSSDDIAKIRNNAKAVALRYDSEIQSALSDVRTLANAYLMTNNNYDSLDPQFKSIASKIVNSLDENIASEFENKADVGTYVQSLLYSMKNDPDFKNALNGLFNDDFASMNPEDAEKLVDSYISQIAGILGEDKYELKLRLGFEDVDDLSKKFNNAIKSSVVKFLPNFRQKTKRELKDLRQDDSVNLFNRPQIDSRKLKLAGYRDQKENEPIYSRTFANEDNTKAVVLVPVLPNGTVLSPDDLEKYANDLLSGKTIDADIKMGIFSGEKCFKTSR